MPPPDPVRPAYDGAGLATLVPALLDAADRSWLPPVITDAVTVVLLVLDGLGWEALETHRDRLSTLGAFDGGPLCTVVPSTTAAALTSLTTGTAPSEHGLVGFRVRVDGRVLNALSWQAERGRPPDPVLVQRREPFRSRATSVVTKADFRTSGFTAAHLRGAAFFGWRTVSELVEHCRRLAGARERLVYAYYPGIDEIAHRHGLHDDYYAAELAFADRLVGDLLAALPSSAGLLVTADHGQVHVGAEGWRALGALESLLEACSGDGRFRYLHARSGAAGDLLAAAAEEHGPHAWVLSREQLLDERWLGPVPSAVIRRRLGDVVLAPFEPVAFVDPALPREARLVSAHGSLTRAEMLVPLLAARGGPG